MGMFDTFCLGVRDCPVCNKRHKFKVQFKFGRRALDYLKASDRVLPEGVGPLELSFNEKEYVGVFDCEISNEVTLRAKCYFKFNEDGTVRCLDVDMNSVDAHYCCSWKSRLRLDKKGRFVKIKV